MKAASPCPCGSEAEYDQCCGMFHSGKESAPTAKALMRSRYSAFVKAEIQYLKETTWPPRQKDFDAAGYKERAANSLWLGLTIHECENGQVTDSKGHVRFTARSMMDGKLHEQTENSLFKKKDGRWYYVKPD